MQKIFALSCLENPGLKGLSRRLKAREFAIEIGKFNRFDFNRLVIEKHSIFNPVFLRACILIIYINKQHFCVELKNKF